MESMKGKKNSLWHIISSIYNIDMCNYWIKNKNIMKLNFMKNLCFEQYR